MNNQLKQELLLSMMRIRAAEEKIVAVYAEKSMQTPTHLSIGQEAVAVGVCQALEKDDQVFATHRNHAVYLAKGGNFKAFFGELCGRSNGISFGRAGSAHLTDGAAGIFASPILGGMMPVAVGAALSFKMDHNRQVAVAVFGDAAIEEGVFAESVNFAILKKLPVLFVCENNLYSTQSPLSARQPATPIYQRLRTADFVTQQIDGNDPIAVFETTKEAIARIRSGEGPAFIECLTYRVREHVGPLFDYDRGYRSKAEVDSWIERCPIKRLKEELLSVGIFSQKDLAEKEREFVQAADDAYNQALNSPWPIEATLLDHVY
jgi:TPP-dependent pyruvate/acetoin dehydrogenase alpha subunit